MLEKVRICRNRNNFFKNPCFLSFVRNMTVLGLRLALYNRNVKFNSNISALITLALFTFIVRLICCVQCLPHGRALPFPPPLQQVHQVPKHYSGHSGINRAYHAVQKLDGVGPVDNRPSTDQFHLFVQKMQQQKIGDT